MKERDVMRIGKSETSGFAGQRGARSGDSGNAMVVALLVLLVLTTAGVAYVAVTKSEKQIAGNSMTAAQALYAAEAGITEGLHRMAFPAESSSYIGPAAGPVAGWGRYIVIAPGRSALDPDGPNLEHDGLDNNENGLIDEPGERYPEVLTKQTVNASALRYPYVRVEYKTQGTNLVLFGDADGDPSTPPVENFTKGEPVLRITARGRQGSADKILEAEAVRFPLVQVESAVWAGGPLHFNGNAFMVDGHDHGASPPLDTIPSALPVQGILSQGAAADIANNLSFNQKDNVNGNGGNSSVQQSTFTYNFNQLWSQFSSMADNSFTGSQSFSGSSPSYGSLTDPKVTVVNGNLTCTGNWTGGGILVVNGNLTMGGGSQFSGVVIVLGDINFAGGGPADQAHVVGGLVYQSTAVGASVLSGSTDIYYSTEAVNAANAVGRYTLSWWRER
jgi:hypothetical protein